MHSSSSSANLAAVVMTSLTILRLRTELRCLHEDYHRVADELGQCLARAVKNADAHRDDCMILEDWAPPADSLQLRAGMSPAINQEWARSRRLTAERYYTEAVNLLAHNLRTSGPFATGKPPVVLL